MATTTTAQNKQDAVKSKAILFQLETVAVDGRTVLYETLRRVLKGEGTELATVDFSRYFLDVDLADGLERLTLDRGLKATPAKLEERVKADMQAWAANGSQKLNPVLASWLKRRGAAQVRMGGLSALGEDAMEALSATLGLQDQGEFFVLTALDAGRGLTADAWLKLAKSLNVVPPLCVVLATSMKAVKAAVAAGMRCIALEDAYNAFQDFGGADYVDSDLVDTVIDKVFEQMVRR